MEMPAVDVWEFEYKEDFGPVFLTEGDLLRACEIHNALLRRNFEQTQSILRKVLSIYIRQDPLAICIRKAGSGKPYIPDAPSVEFSLSHSGGGFVIAIHGKAVGVDLEKGLNVKNPMALATRFFSPADAGRLNAMPGELQRQGFLNQWVAKEAALKVEGWGIAGRLHLAECEYLADKIVAVQVEDHIFSIDFPILRCGFPAAVAWSGREKCRLRVLGEADLRIS